MKHIKLAQLNIVLFLTVLLFGCTDTAPEQPEVVAAPQKVTSILTELVRPANLIDDFTLPGNLEAWEDLQLSAEVAGPIRHLAVAEGDRVRAGTLLLEIDSDSVQSRLESERQNYRVTLQKLERFKPLLAEGLVSQQEFDDLQNVLVAAKSSLRTTALLLEKSRPQAPVSGFVDRLYVDRGEFIDMGKPLLRLIQIERLKVLVDVPEKDVAFLSVGQQVDIIPAVISGPQKESLKGTIEHIAYAAEDRTRTYRTKIRIDNPGGKLRPGMIVRARFVRQELQQVISAPLYAVLDRDGTKQVFVAEQGKAHLQKVVTGATVGRRVVISSGLETGQQLVVRGQQLLMDKAPVAVQEN